MPGGQALDRHPTKRGHSRNWRPVTDARRPSQDTTSGGNRRVGDSPGPFKSAPCNLRPIIVGRFATATYLGVQETHHFVADSIRAVVTLQACALASIKFVSVSLRL